MGESFTSFLGDHPFWAIFIAVFMILPMIGAVLHIVLKALGRKGIDNSPPSGPAILPEDADGENPESEKNNQ